MMQVSDVNKVKENSSLKVKKTTSGGDFSAYLRDIIQSPVESISGTVPLSAADAIFATQMVGEEEEKELKKQQIKRGNSLLEKFRFRKIPTWKNAHFEKFQIRKIVISKKL